MVCRALLAGDNVLALQGLGHLLCSTATVLDTITSPQAIEGKAKRSNPELIFVALVQPSIPWLNALLNLGERYPGKVVLLSLKRVRETQKLPPCIEVLSIAGLNACQIDKQLFSIVQRLSKDCCPLERPEALSPDRHRPLSSRELDVLKLVAEGASTKQIAARLLISVRTVDFHRANIQNKTGLHSVASLTRYAMEQETRHSEGRA